MLSFVSATTSKFLQNNKKEKKKKNKNCRNDGIKILRKEAS